MADEPQTPEIDENDELLLTEQVEPGTEAPEADDDEDADEEEVIGFGGDDTEPQEGDSGLVKHLRQVARDAQREAAELRKKVTAPKPVEVGPKPTLWDEEIAGDEDKYDAAMEAWRENKSAADRVASEATTASEEQQKALATRLEKVVAEKQKLGPAADDAFENVKAALGEERAAAIVMIADTEEGAAKLIVALGTHPTQLAALAGETDPVRFVKEVAKLEGQVKVVKKKKVIEPDTPERGSGRMSRETTDKTLAKLEKEADRTGDRTEVIRYKRKLRAAGKA